MVKFSKRNKKDLTSQPAIGKSTNKTLDGGAPVSQNQMNHPLSSHPCYRLAIDKLCKNNVNLLDVPGKLELKPYWK